MITGTDRELLELAAKAAGYGNIAPDDEDGVFIKDGRVWNPLNNDGDSFCLEVELNLIGSPDFDRIYCILQMTNGYDNRTLMRRAIVLAAAEIGRGMP